MASPWEAVRAGLAAFLDACAEPAFRRIVVLDSVSVLQAKVLEARAVDPVAARDHVDVVLDTLVRGLVGVLAARPRSDRGVDRRETRAVDVR